MHGKMRKILSSTNLDETAEEGTCFSVCPLRHGCCLWLWNAWNVNFPVCSCTDERLIALDNSFAPDETLLEEWKKNNPAPFRKAGSGNRTFVIR